MEDESLRYVADRLRPMVEEFPYSAPLCLAFLMKEFDVDYRCALEAYAEWRGLKPWTVDSEIRYWLERLGFFESPAEFFWWIVWGGLI